MAEMICADFPMSQGTPDDTRERGVVRRRLRAKENASRDEGRMGVR